MGNWLIATFIPQAEILNAQTRNRFGVLASWVGIVCNLVLTVTKGAIGFAVGSISIVADAANNLSDTSSNLVTLLGFKLAAKPADKEHPFGHGRFEYLSSFVVSALIIAVGVQLCTSSFDRIIHPETPLFTIPVVIIMVGSIVLKLWMSRFNTAIGKRIDSGALIAAGTDYLNDCITTGVILACAVISWKFGFNLDGYAGFGVGLYIIKTGIDSIKETLNPLLGHSPDPELVKHITQKIMSYEYILGTHDLMIHDYGPDCIFAVADVEMSAELNPLVSHAILEKIIFDFAEDDHIQLTLHLDPVVLDDPYLNALKDWLETHKSDIDDRLIFHDVRVNKQGGTTIFFDCIVPHDLDISVQELRRQLTEIVLGFEPQSSCKIRLDVSYTDKD